MLARPMGWLLRSGMALFFSGASPISCISSLSGALQISESRLRKARWIACPTAVELASMAMEEAEPGKNIDFASCTMADDAGFFVELLESPDSSNAIVGMRTLESKREVWYPACPSMTAKNNKSPAGDISVAAFSVIAHAFASSIGSLDARNAVVCFHTIPFGLVVLVATACSVSRVFASSIAIIGKVRVSTVDFPSDPRTLILRSNVCFLLPKLRVE